MRDFRDDTVMKILAALAVVLCVVTGCNTKEKYAANKRNAEQWLRANTGSASVNVDGAWDGSESGWGAVRFEQSGSRVTGVMGNYSAQGTVRGSRLYLLLRSGEWVYYTAILRKEGSTLTGFYSPSVPFSSADQSIVTLRR